MGEARFGWCAEVLESNSRHDPVLGMIVLMPCSG
jgi:hypothetical protein